MAIFGLVTGLVLGTSRLSVAISIPLSAVLAAAIILWSVGGEFHPELDQLARLDMLRAAGIDAALTAYRFQSIQQGVVMAIGMGVLMWATAYTAAFAVYRRHHVLDAILLIGAFLVINLVATIRDLFGFLVLFSLAALLLWLRAALVERRSSWQQRRVNENIDVPASIMRSGVLFTAVSIGLAWVLTSVAVAAPLTSAVKSLDQIWLDFAAEASGFFQGLNSSNARPVSSGFGPSMTVGPSWSTNDDPVLNLIGAERPFYLASVSYDHYTGRGWEWTGARQRSVAAEEDIFPSWTPDRPLVADGFEAVTVTVQILKPQGRDLYAPGFPVRFFAPTVVTETSAGPIFGGIDAAGALDTGQMYDVTAIVSEVTEAQLAAAPTDYEPQVAALYLDTDVHHRPDARAGARHRGAGRRDRSLPPGQGARRLPAQRIVRLRHVGRLAAGRQPGHGRLLPPRVAERLLHVLRLGHGHDGPQPGHSRPPDRGLRPRHADRGRGVQRDPEERPCLGRALLPRLRLADLRVHQVHQPTVQSDQR